MSMNDLPDKIVDEVIPSPDWGKSTIGACPPVVNFGPDHRVKAGSTPAGTFDVNGRHMFGRLPGPGVVRPPHAGGKATGLPILRESPVADFGSIALGPIMESTARCLGVDAIRGSAHYHVKMGAKHNRQASARRGRSHRRARVRARPCRCLSPWPNKPENPGGSSPVPYPGVSGAGRSGTFDIGPWWRVAETSPLIGPGPEARDDDRGVCVWRGLHASSSLAGSTISDRRPS